VSPTDVLTYATVCATLLIAAAIAGAAPAVRALRSDPALALRAEI
jgi:ABC-type lipoprotein release transport system permease subunit